MKRFLILLLVLWCGIAAADADQPENTIWIDDPLVNDVADYYKLTYLIDRRDKMIEIIENGNLSDEALAKRQQMLDRYNLYIQQGEAMNLKSDDILKAEEEIKMLNEDIQKLEESDGYHKGEINYILALDKYKAKKQAVLADKAITEVKQYELKTANVDVIEEDGP